MPARRTVMRDLGARLAPQRLDRLSFFQPSVDLPSTSMIWSPVSMPARSAGVSGSGATTVIQPSRTSIWMPRPGVVARGLLGERLVVVAGQQHRVGILELLQHPVRGLLVEIGLAHRVDVVGADVAQDVVEQPGLLVDVAAAGCPAAAASRRSRTRSPPPVRSHPSAASYLPPLPQNDRPRPVAGTPFVQVNSVAGVKSFRGQRQPLPPTPPARAGPGEGTHPNVAPRHPGPPDRTRPPGGGNPALSRSSRSSRLPAATCRAWPSSGGRSRIRVRSGTQPVRGGPVGREHHLRREPPPRHLVGLGRQGEPVGEHHPALARAPAG